MESFYFKLSLLGILIPCVLLATSMVAETTGDDELRTFIVRVQPPEKHVFAIPDDRTAWYRSFLPEDGRLLHAYHHAASGFAARLTQRELDVPSVTPGFLAAQPNVAYELLTTHTPRFLGLDVPQEGVSTINHSASGFGDGVIIGVLDTGLRSFASDPSPLDMDGHGTHTSSTAAGAVVHGAQVLGQARGTASGIAPRAHVAMYKPCGDECTSAAMLACIDAAVGDGCDVLSISLRDTSSGSDTPFYQDSLAIGTYGAVDKGIFVSISAGNSGPNASTLFNDAPWMLTVAASTMDRLIGSQVRLGNGLSFDGESLYQPEISAAVFYPLVYAGASSTADARFCGNGSLDGFDVKGKIVLCDRGNDVGRVDKGAEVKRAGGIGMIMANEFSNGYSTLPDVHVLPASHVNYPAGAANKKYINSTANPIAQIFFRGTVLGASPAPAITSFSSRGPSQRNPGILKPDITGPGVTVLAAWPTQVVGPPSSSVNSGPTFNFDSGTSMSAPHLAGVAALIKSKHPGWSPAAIRSAIVTTADPIDRSGNPILDEQHMPADFFATSAGHVNPVKAVDPGLVYDIAPDDYVRLLCSVYASRDVSVIARRAVDCSAIRVIPEHALNYPSISVVFPQAWNSTANPVAVVHRTVRNVGEAPTVYYPYVDLPSSMVNVEPRSLQFTEANQEQSFTVSVRRGRSGNAKVVQGALRWASDKHTVTSPISITFE
ncbi:unnamed protein product [Miscanthus lutarioriparius]|uniref:Uncharacterized protein n=1 Tax=Miscanthus lutarioriparius TaxID=422564 RepID=A0A811S9F4_9POAL|nr:unnamed protein product [Miscanthus lutarioriparius]